MASNKNTQQAETQNQQTEQETLVAELEKKLAEANARADAAEAKLQVESATPTCKAATEEKTAKVKVKLYKDKTIKDDVQVFVNGRQYIIKRGVEVEVPAEVYEVLCNKERMLNVIVAYNEAHADKT